MTYNPIHTQPPPSLLVALILNGTKGFMNVFNPASGALSLGVVSMLLSSISIPGFAAGYNITKIPVPNIKIPAGRTARPVCLSINDFGRVACNLEIVETLNRTPVDRLAPSPKIFASYAYAWDSKTNALTLLSRTKPTTFDRANVITDTNFVGGSTATFKKPPIGTVWTLGVNTRSLLGPGEIVDINNPGDYVQNNQLFINKKTVGFAGTNAQVEAINNPSPATNQIQAAGMQALDQPVKISGIGLLYSNELSNPVPSNPIYAVTSRLSEFSVTSLSDNGNFVISGKPNTASALTALSCTTAADCEAYLSTVAASGRGKSYIRLNSIDNMGHAVGTDGGVALLINPPSTIFPNGTRVDLNSLLPNGSFSNFGWFLNEATSINNNGDIVGLGLKGGKYVAFLLTPI